MMNVQINTMPVDHEHSCNILEALAEGIVLANMLEIQAEDEDGIFPCCVKCGKFKIMLDRVEVDCARALVERGGGNPLALICYQVAQRRIDGDDPKADVVIEHVVRNGKIVEGEFRPLVRKGDMTIDDPLAALETQSSCGCGGHP